MSEDAYESARRSIVNNALRRQQKSLDLSNKKLTALPPEIGQLTGPRHLDLKGNQLTALPPEIGQLTALQRLNLNANQLTALPPEIGQLTALQRLDLNANQLTALPPEIGQLTALQRLYLNENQLSALPPDIGQLTALQRLDLHGNQLSALPPEIGHLTALKSLYLNRNQLGALPPDIRRLTELKGLDLDENQLSALPPEIGQLTALQVLRLRGNKLSALPPEIGQLTALQRLRLVGNQISALPPEIGQLTALQVLGLDGNQLSALPQEIGQLTSLQSLYLSRNQLTALPPEIAQLTALEFLRLEGNQLTALPPEIGQMTALRHLDLNDNPLPYPYPILTAGGQPSATVNVLAWLRGELDPATLESPNKSTDLVANGALSTDQLRLLANQLEQNPIGARFEQSGDYFAIASSGFTSDHEAAADPVTRQLHSNIQLKARELASRTLRLSNVPGWQALPGASHRFQKLVDQDLQRVVDQIGVAWAELVSLGSFVEQDDEVRHKANTFIEALELDVRRSLVDLIQTTGPWLRRFPTVVKLDDEHASFLTPRDKVPPARKVLTAVKRRKIVRADDIAVLDDALDAGDHVGHQSSKARSYGVFSVRNVVIGTAALAATSLAEGFFDHIGEEVGKHSRLAEKSIALILKSEDALMHFLDDLPADIRAAVRTLVEELKKRVS
jgi:Leucine-rich repeat (LRR) protein